MSFGWNNQNANRQQSASCETLVKRDLFFIVQKIRLAALFARRQIYGAHASQKATQGTYSSS